MELEISMNAFESAEAFAYGAERRSTGPPFATVSQEARRTTVAVSSDTVRGRPRKLPSPSLMSLKRRFGDTSRPTCRRRRHAIQPPFLLSPFLDGWRQRKFTMDELGVPLISVQ